MPQIDEPTTSGPKAVTEAKKPKPNSVEPKKSPELYALTVDTTTGQIVTVERVIDDGARRPLTSDEKAQLEKAAEAMPLRRLVEQAFEAGIEAVLGDDAEGPEGQEDGELSGLLLQTLIEGSKLRELVKDDSLHGTVVGALVGHAAAKS